MNESRFAAPEARWQPPAELLRSTPRPVRLTGVGKALAGIAVALLAGALFGGVWLYVLATRDAARVKLMRAEGVSAEGEVLYLGRTQGNEPRYFLTYRYTAAGQEFHGRANLRRREWRIFQIGSRLPVRYLPSHLEFSWIPGHEPTGLPLWVAPIAPLGLMLGAAAIAYTLRRQARLLAEGRPAAARVTQTRRIRTGNHTGYRVSFEYTLLSGATRTGYYDRSRKPPPAGSVMTILYDPDEPRRSAQYPLPLVRVDRL